MEQELPPESKPLGRNARLTVLMRRRSQKGTVQRRIQRTSLYSQVPNPTSKTLLTRECGQSSTVELWPHPLLVPVRRLAFG